MALSPLRVPLLVVAGLLIASACAQAAPAPKLYVQETEHVRVVYYSPAHEYLVRYLIQCYENALRFESNLLHYSPKEKVAVLIEDFGDYGHGGAGTLPRNFISVGMEPINHSYETLPANERISWIVNHELIHIIMSDNSSPRDRLFRRLFAGKILTAPEDPVSMLYSALASPRHYSPRWWHEGIAAFMETWMSGGIGRGLGGYDEMVFRAMVRDGAHIYDAVGLESEGTTIDFQVGANAYLYGTRFLTWLCREYGPQKLLQWISRTNDTKGHYATQFRAVYQNALGDEWRKWIAAEREWQTANLKRIAEFPVTHVKPLAGHALGSVSRPYYDTETRRVYAAVRYPGAMAHLAAISTETGKYERLTDVHGAAIYYVTSLAFDAEGRRLFYTSDNSQWRGLNVYDLKTRTSRRLIRNYRAGDLAYNKASGGLWAVRHSDGLVALVRSAEPFTEIRPVFTFAYGTEFFDIDVSPDGVWLTGAMADVTGKQKLVRARTADLAAGKANFETIFDFGYNSPGNFVFSPDGRYLYGSSYYTGAANVFRINPDAPELEALTNSDTGLFRPLPLPDGRLLAMEYTASGFSPGWVVNPRRLTDVNSTPYLGQATFEKHPMLRDWKLSAPSSVNMDSVITRTGPYSPVRMVRTQSIIPVVQGYKSSQAGGFRFDFGDRLRIARASLTATYSPDSSLPLNERFHGTLDARLWSNRLVASWNQASFYDLFGPTKVSRRGWGVRFEREHKLLYENLRTLDLTWSFGGYSGLDRLPDYQNISVQHSRFLLGRVDLTYTHLQKSLGAVENESGTTWSLRSNAYFTGRDAFPQVQGSWDRGILLPMRNSSLWVRAAAGQAAGNAADPFANFYFGGFGNNWVDHASISRFREAYALPGVGLNAIGGNRFGRGQVEWDLPPKRFQHFGNAAAYINWARLSLFSSGLIAHSPSAAVARGKLVDAGAQLDLRLVLMTYLETTLSGGYAVAVDEHGRRSGGYMVSLKIQ